MAADVYFGSIYRLVRCFAWVRGRTAELFDGNESQETEQLGHHMQLAYRGRWLDGSRAAENLLNVSFTFSFWVVEKQTDMPLRAVF